MVTQNKDRQDALRQAYEALLRRSGHDRAFKDTTPSQPPDVFADGEFNPQAAAAMIRFLENQRGYSSFKTVGTEPMADYMARLATVRQRKGPYLGDRLPPLQQLLNDQLAEIHTWAEYNGIHLPTDVFVGLFPTGELNARVVPVPGLGALLLVNAGLMDLVFVVLKTIMATAGDDRYPPPLQSHQATMVLAEAFNNYLYGEGSLSSWGMPRLDRGRERQLEFVLRRAEQFVLAHELGHIVAGHVAIMPAGTAAPAALDPRHEFIADRIAVDLLMESDPLWLYREPDEHARYLSGAILTFFAVAAAIDFLQKELAIPRRTTGSHPALAERIENIRALLAEELPVPDLFGRADAFAGWMATHISGIVEWFQKIDTFMNRPGRWS